MDNLIPALTILQLSKIVWVISETDLESMSSDQPCLTSTPFSILMGHRQGPTRLFFGQQHPPTTTNNHHDLSKNNLFGWFIHHQHVVDLYEGPRPTAQQRKATEKLKDVETDGSTWRSMSAMCFQQISMAMACFNVYIVYIRVTLYRYDISLRWFELRMTADIFSIIDILQFKINSRLEMIWTGSMTLQHWSTFTRLCSPA